MDETTDVGSEAQLLVFCRFPDVELNKISDHYLFCQPLGVNANSTAIFQKLDDYFKQNNLSWKKYKSVTTDGAAAMQGTINGAVSKIKDVSPDCISIHCVIHREALVAKKLKGTVNNESSAVFQSFLGDVISMVNYIRGRAKKHRMFIKLCEGMEASHKRLIFHCEVRWLSRRRVLSRVFELRKEWGAFFLEEKDQRATKFFDHLWLAKLSYMACVFEHLNKLNICLQGKDSDVFKSTGEVDALKLKIPLWKKRVKSQNFSDFPMLGNFIDECEESFAESVMTDLVPLILAHLELLQENFENYFPKEQSSYLEANTWVLQPFIDSPTEDEDLLDLRTDLSQKVLFEGTPYADFWVQLWHVPKYKKLAEKDISLLIQSPSTYLCESGFSTLSQIKTKQRNSIEKIDYLMRGALETEFVPRYDQLVGKLQNQKKH